MPAILAESDAFADLTDPALDGRWLDFKAAARHQRRRPDDRLRHRRRPRGHLLPLRPVRGGRAAHRPRGGRRPDRHLGRLLRPRRGVRRRGARHRLVRLPRRHSPRRCSTRSRTRSRPTTAPSTSTTPTSQAVWSAVTEQHRQGPLDPAAPVGRRLDGVVPERRLRHDGLPRLDARRHRGQRRGRRGLGRRRRLPRRRRQLGRLLPDRAGAGRPPRGGQGVRCLDHRARAAAKAFAANGAFPSQVDALDAPRSSTPPTRSSTTRRSARSSPTGPRRSRSSPTRARSTPTSCRPSRPRCCGSTTGPATPDESWETFLSDVEPLS